MRFMMIVKASPESEAGKLPTTQELEAMGKYNEELVKAGILLAGEGLHASSKGTRVRFSGKQSSVVDGPFTETKELVAGFWIIEVKSKEEAVAWARRVPFVEGEIEIRQVASAEDFAPSDPTGELMAREEQLRAQVEQRAKS
ncbi:YciI family protein [Corallococcus praedator]|uniref:YciI family protein n=1 Tax=Corallococcus praedator TaxID=2316724 RepID=A0ABX9QE74_9BACT|nr:MULTISPECIES: YciI family protein [Corallococcus]RKH25975.1 YciI family protein [Corallococcus sp. CA031C]RKI03370.1 YciI family protein [Corallococcus praedator]